MNKLIQRTAIAALALLCALPVHAFQLSIDGQATNNYFPLEQEIPATDTKLTRSYFLGGTLWCSIPVTEQLGFTLGYQRDPILRDAVSLALRYSNGSVIFEGGPQYSFDFLKERPTGLGLIALARIVWPDHAYVGMQLESTGFLTYLQLQTSNRNRLTFETGLAFSNVVISGNATVRQFASSLESGSYIGDLVTSFGGSLELFKKNFPISILMSGNYDIMRRENVGTKSGALNMIRAGFVLKIQFSTAFSMHASYDMYPQVVGKGALSSSAPDGRIDDFGLGLLVDTEAKLPRNDNSANASVPEGGINPGGYLPADVDTEAGSKQ